MKPTPNTVLRAAILDGVPVVRSDRSRAVFGGGDGALTIIEFARLSRGGEAAMAQTKTRDRIGRYSALAPYNDKLAAGAWHYTGRYADLSDTDSTGDPLMLRGSSGAYVVGERLLIGDDAGSGKRLSAFGQAGFADARMNRFSSYFGAGIVGSGWGPMREADEVGISIAHARNGSHYMRAAALIRPRRAETTVELSYLTRVSKYMTFQPDIQYVAHPNTDPALADALVLQLRFEIAF
jgi:porin